MKQMFFVMALMIAQCMTAVGSDQPPGKKSVLLGKVTDEAGKPLAGIVRTLQVGDSQIVQQWTFLT